MIPKNMNQFLERSETYPKRISMQKVLPLFTSFIRSHKFYKFNIYVLNL